MSTCTKPVQKQPSTKLSLTGVGLCALCCALPLIATALGLGSLSTVAFYLEKAGLGLILLGAFLSIIFYVSSRKRNLDAAQCATAKR
jgi:hypothetical protein